jgi:hypothetical protein
MSTLHDRRTATSITRRGFNVEPSPIHPATMARVELLRSHIDDTVKRAQRNLEARRAALREGGTAYVYAKGNAEKDDAQRGSPVTTG